MNTAEQKTITRDILNEAMDYSAYRSLIDDLLEKGRTTGSNQSDEMTQYTKMNVQRMKRIDKTISLNPSLKAVLENVQEPWIWLVLTEGWCGDAAQNVPVIHKMAGVSQAIDLKFLLRDDHLDIMDAYLTNGGRSIPKLICLHAETLEEIGTWGPRPGDFQQKAMEWKDDPELSMEGWAEKLHKWYAGDKTQTLQNEFETLIKKWNK